MIGIRVDVNRIIATGHIKRDIAIALCLRQLGEEPLFMSADENCLPYLEPYHFQSKIFHSNWMDMDSELEDLRKIIKKYNITSLLVDSYQITESYIKVLKECTKVTCFDELYKLGYGCQQLINGMLLPPDYSMAPGKTLLGADYVSLRREFIGLPPKHIRHEIKKILVTSGGSDNYHFGVRFVEEILKKPEWEDVMVILVVGEFCEDKAYLKSLYEKNDRVELYINTKHMAFLMQDADYVVTAGGTTLYEVCAVGVSASCYAIADNQIDISKTFEKKGLMSYAGDFRKNADKTIENILAQMDAAKDEKCRKKQAERLQKLVDGKGAYRIAKALLDIQ